MDGFSISRQALVIITEEKSLMTTNRPLRVFLCHSSNDKPAVRELYQKLRAEAWIQPWLDEEELYPGQDWNMEIEKAVEAADAIIVCLTKNSINKEGYVQRELRIVLDFADYKPEGTIYILPVRLEECEPPRRLRAWQYADYFEGQRDRALERLLVSLKKRADSLDLKIEEHVSIQEEKSVVENKSPENKSKPVSNKVTRHKKDPKIVEDKKPIVEISKVAQVVNPPNKITLSNGMEFMRVPAGKFFMGSKSWDRAKPQHIVDIPYDYWMARFPVINALYTAYTTAQGINHPVDGWEKKKDHPVVKVSWNDAMIYCRWLNNLFKDELPLGLILRLPTEAEWEKSARGTDGREYPWGNEFDSQRCSVEPEDQNIVIYFIALTFTTPVKKYSPQGDSPYGCADMIGNVWEWTHSLKKSYPYNADDGREDEKSLDVRVLRGVSRNYLRLLSCSYRSEKEADYFDDRIGFRVCLAPPFPK